MAFDTLSYARRLKTAGMPEAQAEAVADATQDLIGARFATKDDLKTEIAALDTRIAAVMERLELRLTLRVGTLIAVGVAILAAIIKF